MTMKPLNRGPRLRDTRGVDASMKLPAGKTCGDCHHFNRCAAFVGQIEADEVCDWAPCRFIERPKASPSEAPAARVINEQRERVKAFIRNSGVFGGAASKAPVEAPETMHGVYGDGSDHKCCPKCGYCLDCNDCANFGCGASKAPVEAPEPVGEVVIEDMGRPFNAMQVRVQFYKECPPVGTKLYTAPQAVEAPAPVDQAAAVEFYRLNPGAALFDLRRRLGAVEAPALSDEQIEAWADTFIRKQAYNRSVAVQIAVEAAKWVRSRQGPLLAECRRIALDASLEKGNRLEMIVARIDLASKGDTP